ncbi:plasmid maintenance protein [Borreliella burgdorferi]|uniref:plasmid maintenance protein n=1 Tax=Borreliella burgdorferi TaxID=139 RepID=UPI0011B1DFF2|nr:plasmid maintenance protein [Borreliella burgdorferi]MCR8910011.1 plasmid maintenance protein [Borreliella burgdorferi 297]UUX89567.1 plasmid maintenance protein [Borreliella burgdorferi]
MNGIINDTLVARITKQIKFAKNKLIILVKTLDHKNKELFHSTNKNYTHSLIKSKFNSALAKTTQHEVNYKTLLEYLEILEKNPKVIVKCSTNKENESFRGLYYTPLLCRRLLH